MPQDLPVPFRHKREAQPGIAPDRRDGGVAIGR